MTKLFQVVGPFEVPVEEKKAGRMVSKDVTAFWKDVGTIRKARGCYVFAIRAGGGITPTYVGKTKKSFEQECFQSHKRADHYNPALLDYKKGTPVMFFVYAPTAKGKPNARRIGRLESFLINTARVRNPSLTNVQGTKGEDWGISGILRSGKGKPSNAARGFRKMMWL